MKSKIIARELKRLAKQNGGLLLPAKVVEAAKPETSPLHSRFEWNDRKASHAYRLWQARQLISITVEKHSGSGKTYEMFVSLHSDRKKGDGYRLTATVMNDDESKAELLQNAFDELQIFKLKYSRLKELARIFSAIEEAVSA